MLLALALPQPLLLPAMLLPPPVLLAALLVGLRALPPTLAALLVGLRALPPTLAALLKPRPGRAKAEPAASCRCPLPRLAGACQRVLGAHRALHTPTCGQTHNGTPPYQFTAMARPAAAPTPWQHLFPLEGRPPLLCRRAGAHRARGLQPIRYGHEREGPPGDEWWVSEGAIPQAAEAACGAVPIAGRWVERQAEESACSPSILSHVGVIGSSER